MDFTEVVSIIASSVVSGGAAGAAVVWLAKTILTERIESAIRHEYSVRLEAYKSELKSAAEKEFEDFKSQLREVERLGQERWNIKRAACLDALDVVDRQMTNMAWGKLGVCAEPQKVDIARARQVMNNLVLICDGAEVAKAYIRALGLQAPDEPAQQISGDAIHDLRLTIRQELGFGPHFDFDRNKAWIATLTSRQGQGIVTEPPTE